MSDVAATGLALVALFVVLLAILSGGVVFTAHMETRRRRRERAPLLVAQHAEWDLRNRAREAAERRYRDARTRELAAVGDGTQTVDQALTRLAALRRPEGAQP